MMVVNNLTYENYQLMLKMTRLIDGRLNRIWEDTKIYSGNEHTLHVEYKNLLEMGTRIIPYLIHRLSHHGGDWATYSLLCELTGECPIQETHRGKFDCILADWLLWYRDSKYYTTDPYYGLLTK